MALLTQYVAIVACDMYHQHEEKRKGWKRRKMGKEGDEDVVDARQDNSRGKAKAAGESKNLSEVDGT